MEKKKRGGGKEKKRVGGRTYPSSLLRIWTGKAATTLIFVWVHCHVVIVADSTSFESLSLGHLLCQCMLLAHNRGSYT
jgi:hypothetical protein